MARSRSPAVIVAAILLVWGCNVDDSAPLQRDASTPDLASPPVPGQDLGVADLGAATSCQHLVFPSLSASDVQCGGGRCRVPSGRYSGALRFSASNVYELAGQVFIGDGTEACSGALTIEAGTRIESRRNPLWSSLIILPNSEIRAEGTADAPIVFTSAEASPWPGDWGGVVLSGRASVNCGGLGTTCLGENDSGSYGGTVDADDSGVLRYVRIEYAGLHTRGPRRFNGLGLQGVGSGTLIDHVHVHRVADDGIGILGGTVNAKHLIITGAEDDSFDWAFGWRGRAQFVIARQHASPSGADNGLEGGSNEQDNEALPRSHPLLSNLTLIGAPRSVDSDLGIQLRTGTGGEIWSAVVYGFEAGLDLRSDGTFTNAPTSTGLTVRNSVLCNVQNFRDDPQEAFAATDFFIDAQGSFPRNVGNEAMSFPDCDLGLEAALDESAPNFTPPVESPLRSGGQSPSDPFFDPAPYRGAVEPGSGAWWTWTRFD